LVIKTDEHWAPERAVLEQGLKILQQPIPLLGK
jgi:hypothetical protein